MKRLFLFFIAFIALAEVHAQGWQELGTGSHALKATAPITSMCADSGNVIYAAASFTDSLGNETSYVVKWDGSNWSKLGNDTDTLNAFNYITSICIDHSHNVYAAIEVNDTNENFKVMKWDGSNWAELGTGIYALYAGSSINTICADAMGNIYAAGSFIDSSGYNYVAKWNGVTWSELGTGSNALNANYDILSIAADNKGNIYAAGGFKYIPGGYCYVAKWNGASWSEPGMGSNALNTNGQIFTIATDLTGNIYAGGQFSTDTNWDPCVANWDGTKWNKTDASPMAIKEGEDIMSITTDALGNVYAAGDIVDTAGKSYMVKFNHITGTWNELGTGSGKLNANSTIYAICTDAEGNVYAAGSFTDGVTYNAGYNYVAFYNHLYENVQNINSIDSKIHVYPNPSNEYIHITGADAGSYKMVDMYGKLVLFGETHIGNSSIDISGLPQGVYLLQIGNESGRVFKIVKE